MIDQLRKIPNQLTAIRFVTIPVMWVCALLGVRIYLGVGFGIGLISDLFDGAIARKLNQTSDFGSKFDSLTDQFLQMSSIVWILILMPEVVTDNLLISLVALGAYFMSLAVGLIKFKRLANLHLYISKVGGLFLYLFLIHAFIVGQYSQALFILAGLFLILSSLETLVLQLTLSEVDAQIGSIFLQFLRDDHPIRYYLSLLP
jgi:cardiolipin synthase